MKQRKTVLLADASEEFRALLRNAIERTGEFSVETVGEGNRILPLVLQRAPDLLIMDVLLPGADGIAILKELQRQGCAPVTIFTSGFVSDQLLAEATEAGAAYFLPKPFDLNTLLDRMRGFSAKQTGGGLPSLQVSVSEALHEVGVPAHVKGYRYLREAILMVMEEPELIHAVTKVLYPTIARRYGTTMSRVERACRHAVSLAWERGDPKVLRHRFGSTMSPVKGRPTNSEFISTMAEYLDLQYGSDACWK